MSDNSYGWLVTWGLCECMLDRSSAVWLLPFHSFVTTLTNSSNAISGFRIRQCHTGSQCDAVNKCLPVALGLDVQFEHCWHDVLVLLPHEHGRLHKH